SIDSQRMIMEDFIDQHPEIVGYELYIDNGLTGRHFDRPAFQTMLNDIELGRVNCVITKDLSRLGRNCIDTGYYIEKYFLMRGVRYIAINEGFDTAEHPDGDTGLMVPILNMLNETFSRDIGRKVKASCDQRMDAGDYIGGRAPYGYCKAPDNCRKLLVDPESAAVVRMIFAWAAEGMALNDIVMRLNEAKILTPSRYAASRGIIAHEKLVSNRWQTRTISKILSDELYTGDMVQGRTVSVDRKQQHSDPGSWVRVPNTHEAIISHELFETVQTVRAEIAQKWKEAQVIPFSENILKGKIFCGHCGKSLHRERSHDKYRYRCISNDRIAKDACAGKVYLPETELFETILTILHQESEAIAGQSPLTAQAETALCVQRKDLQRQLTQTRTASDTGKGYFRTLYESMVSGVITAQ
ncbi:MAG: recombinase family protein, partial [Oscillospiraceae bacterium]